MQITELSTALAANNFGKDSSLVFIEANDSCDSSFMITSLMWESVNSNSEIMTLMFHHSLQHYLQLLSKIAHSTSLTTQKLKKVNLNPTDYLEDDVLNTQMLIQDITIFCQEKKDTNACIIIDDISYLCLLSSFRDCVRFSRICIKLLSQFPNFKLIVGCHVTSNDEELSVISGFFQNSSSFIINLYPLQSGFSSDVTGHLKIDNRKNSTIRISKYNYKLEDKKLTVMPYVLYDS